MTAVSTPKRKHNQQSPGSLNRRLLSLQGIRALNGRDTALILTHQKAGTHLLRYLLTNYIRLLEDPEAPAASIETVRQVLPNMRLYVTSGKDRIKPPYKASIALPFRDLIWSHVADSVVQATDEYHLGKKVLCWRNPLDFLVSIYFYNYKNRSSEAVNELSVGDVLNKEIGKYAAQVYYMRRILRERPKLSYGTTYEELTTNCEETFTSIVRFLGLPHQSRSIELAVRRSQFDQVRSEEKQRAKPLAGAIDGYFTRSGKIGQWKELLGPADIEAVELILSEYSIALSDFTLE